MSSTTIHPVASCLCACLLSIGPTSNGQASPPEGQFYSIRQERSAHDGVLVSRPNGLDLEIKDLLTSQNITSLEDYSQWLATAVDYQSDAQKDQWAEPQQTLRSRRGDCEDYAFLNSAVLRVMGYQPHIIAMVKGKRAHAVCAFKKNGTYVWLDNSKINMTSATSLEQLAEQIVSQYKYSRLFKINPATRTWTLLYRTA